MSEASLEGRPSRRRLVLVMSVGIASVSAAAVLIRSIPEVPVAVIAAVRVTVAAAVVGALGGGRIDFGPWRRGRREFVCCLLAGLFLAGHFLAWIGSLRLTSVASSVVLVAASPLFVALGGWAWLGERPRPAMWAGLGLGVAGMLLIGWADRADAGRPTLGGDALALLGALMAAGYLLCGRVARRRYAILTHLFWVYGVAAVALLARLLAAPVSVGGWPGRTYAILLAVAVFPQLIGHSTFNWALRHLAAARVALLALAEPIGASLLAWLFLGERPGAVQGAGCLILLAGVALGCRDS